MQPILVLGLLVSVAHATANKRHKHSSTTSDSSCSSSGSHEGAWPNENVNVVIWPDGQSLTQQFYFEESGKPAKQAFQIYLGELKVLNVWDCHCGGDQFAVFDNGQQIGTANLNCDGANASCNIFNDDPAFCKNTAGFCSFGANNAGPTLQAGFHNITIVPTVSLFSQGYGYLQVINFITK